MLVLLYCLGYILIGILDGTFKSDKFYTKNKSIYVFAYNYVFCAATIIYASLEYATNDVDIAQTVVICLYRAIGYMIFKGDVGIANGNLDMILLFLVISVSTSVGVLSLFFYKIINNTKMWLKTVFAKNIFIVVGKKKEIDCFVKDIHKNKKHAAVIAILIQSEKENNDLVKGSLSCSYAFLNKLKRRKKYYLTLLPRDDDNNYEILSWLNERYKECKVEINVAAYLKNDYVRFEDLKFENLDCYIISREKQVVDKFLMEHRPLQYMIDNKKGSYTSGVFEAEEKFSLAVIGYDSLSEEFMLSTFEKSGFSVAGSNDYGCEITVLNDVDAEETLYQKVPYFRKHKYVSWISMHLEAYEWMQRFIKKQLSQIFVNVGSTEKNIDIAVQLVRLYRNEGLVRPQIVIVVHEKKPKNVIPLLQQKDIFFIEYGVIQYSYIDLIEREYDKRAKKIHEVYMKGKTDSENTWDKMSTFLRESNRHVIDDIPNKLDMLQNKDHEANAMSSSSLEKLSIYEHRRWNLFHLTRGWLKLPLDQLSDEEIKKCTLKRVETKRHACLLKNWYELDGLPQSRPHEIREYDTQNVKMSLQIRM